MTNTKQKCISPFPPKRSVNTDIDLSVIEKIDDYILFAPYIENGTYKVIKCIYTYPMSIRKEIEFKTLSYLDDYVMRDLLIQAGIDYPNDPDYNTDDVYKAFRWYRGKDLYTNDGLHHALFNNEGTICIVNETKVKVSVGNVHLTSHIVR